MRSQHDGMSLWYGTPDAPAPEGDIQPGTDLTITIGVQPIDASNRVELLYRLNHGSLQTVEARWLRNDLSQHVQYFRTHFPVFRSGDTVEYTVVCHCAGRQVPPAEEAESFPSSFRVVAAQSHASTTAFVAHEAHVLTTEDTNGTVPKEPVPVVSTPPYTMAVDEEIARLFNHTTIDKLLITGHVADPQSHLGRSGQGVAGLRVELWPRDTPANEPVVRAETEDDGRFRMELDQQAALMKEGEDRSGQLEFRVYQRDRLIAVKAAPEVASSDHMPGEVEIPVDGASTSPLAGEGIVSSDLSMPVLPALPLDPARSSVDTHAVVLPKVADLELHLPEKLSAFLQQEQLGTVSDILARGGLARLEGLPVPADDPAVVWLDAHTRLSTLSSDVALQRELIDAGFTSPAAIARLPRESFLAVVEGTVAPEVAQQTHAVAQVQYQLLNHMVAGQQIEAIIGVGSSPFEHPSVCECKDCQAAVSPGAYLADLIDYAATHLQEHLPGFPLPGGINLQYLIELLHQHFDKLPMSCQAIDEPVGQVRLCIEVLRQYLGEQADITTRPAPTYPIQSVFAGDVDGDGRDEVIIITDWSFTSVESAKESNALYVMAYHPMGKFWQHFSPLDDHPYEADVVCGPYPYRVQFGFAADVDGDKQDELVLGIGREGVQTNELWVMKYNLAKQSWQHLSPIANHPFQADVDCSTADVGMRFAVGADVDGDGRAEIVVALNRTGADGRLFWVMDYDPTTLQWKHLSPIANHPLNADLDPLPGMPNIPKAARFVVAGDYDGDKRDELAINIEDPTDHVAGRYFWVMDYESGVQQWKHLPPHNVLDTLDFDYSLPAIPARFGVAADVDDDGRDELLIGQDPYYTSLGSEGKNRLWVVEYDYDSFSKEWFWRELQFFDCSSKPTHAGAALAINSEGTGPKEIAVLPVFEQGSPDWRDPKNGAWIMRLDANAWKHQSPIANHPIEADLDWSTGFSRVKGFISADVDGDGWDEIVLYPTPREALWAMKYNANVNAWQHMTGDNDLPQAERDYRLAAYQLLLNRLGTSFEEVRLARSAGDEERQALAEQLGIDLGTPRPDNLDALYLDPATLTEQQLEALFGLVDTTRDPFAAVAQPMMELWRLAHLRTLWQREDGLTDAYAWHVLPVIDPDLINPDDFRAFNPQETNSPSALWVKRRTWVDVQWDTLRGMRITKTVGGKTYTIPDLEKMLDQMRQTAITYGNHTETVWSQLGSVNDLIGFYRDVTEGDKARVQVATQTIGNRLHLTVDAYIRLMVIRQQAQEWMDEVSDTAVTDAEWSEVHSILTQAIKTAFQQTWLQEERDWEIQAKQELFSTRYFWTALREPREGDWPPISDKPFIDPERVTANDMPDSTVGAQAVDLRKTRQDKLDTANSDLQADYAAGGVEALAAAAFGQPPAGQSWGEKLKALREDLDSADPVRTEPAQKAIDQNLHLTVEQFGSLMALKARLDVKKKPTKIEWTAVYGLLTSALKVRTLYTNWAKDETAKGLMYWQAFKARMPLWRSIAAGRAAWQQALSARSIAPILDPDVINPLYLRASNNLLYTSRQTAIHDRLNLLQQQGKSLPGLEAMFLLPDSLGLTSAEMEAVVKQRDDGASVSGRLEQLSITSDAFGYLARIYRLLTKNAVVLDSEWDAVCDILTQVWKRRQFADWRRAERDQQLTLSQDTFQLPRRDPTVFPQPEPPALPIWRAAPRAIRDWVDTLQARMDQEETVKAGLRAVVVAVEQATLPVLRYALVQATDAPAETLDEKARWISEHLLIEARSDGCQMTTRVEQAIESLQSLLWSARTGQLDLALTLVAADFDEEWKWIGSYAMWRAAMFVYLYPENILHPGLRHHQTRAFRKLLNVLRNNRQLTPIGARAIAADYASYWQDVCRLEVKACAKVSGMLHLFAISSASGKIYWSTQEPDGVPGYYQSYWMELESLKKVNDLIGAVSYRTPSGNRFLYLFIRTQEDDGQKLGFIKFDLELSRWDDEPTPLSVQESATHFEAKLKETAESVPPYLAITLPNGAIYGRSLNPAGIAWESSDFQPIFMQDRPIRWSNLFSINESFLDSGWGDIVVADLDNNDQPDLIFLVEDGESLDHDRYVVGWNVKTDGTVTDWSHHITSRRMLTATSGTAIARINNNDRPDLVVFNTYMPLPGTYGYGGYSIGWDMQKDGNVVSWQSFGTRLPPLEVVIKGIHGSGIAVADINGSGRPDLMVFMIVHPDNQENKAYYWIGWDVQPDGTVTGWSEPHEVPGWFGASNQGGGIALADLNGNGRPDLLVFHIDNPQGENQGYYRIGWNLDTQGNPLAWSGVRPIPGWFGTESADGGIAVADLNRDGLPELIVFHIDDPDGRNYAGYYRIGWSVDGDWNQNWRQRCPFPFANYKPIYTGFFDIVEELADTFLQGRRSDIQQAYLTNEGINANYRGTHLTYLDEAFYHVPIAIALQLQQAGEYVAALDWFRTVYDYTVPNARRKIFYGLKREETIQTPEYTDRAADWLLDPLNPHLIASTRRNTYTRFTLLAIIRCLLEYADAEFTQDTGESIARARLLYTTALELLDAPELKRTKDQCVALIGQITKTFNFWHAEERWEIQWLITVLQGIDHLPLLQTVLREATHLQQQNAPWSEALPRLQQVITRPQANHDHAGTTLAQVVLNRPQQIENAQLTVLSTRAAAPIAALDVIRSPRLSSLQRLIWLPTITYDFCVVPNPVLKGLRLRAELNLYKINTCRNIAGMERQLDPYAAPTDTQSGLPLIGAGGQLVLPGTSVLRPTPYRYAVLIERAKQLVGLAQQVETAFLSALQQRDQEAYTLLKARQDIRLAQAGVRLQDLRVQEAESSVKLAELQKRRAEIQSETYEEWITAGLLDVEINLIRLYGWLATTQSIAATAEAVYKIALLPMNPFKDYAAAIAAGSVAAANIASSIIQANINVSSFYSSYERRKQEWELGKQLADQDIQIGDQQIQIAEDHVRVVGQERVIAEMQTENAEATANFLSTKFTNVELYDWMSGVLKGVYRFFLQQATSMAQLATNQLAFERHETPPSFIQADYWQAPNDAGNDSSDGRGPDRRGLTGSARLLQDIYQLDQYGFETNKRKLQLSKTISLARMAPAEFQQFRQTGVLNLATPMELFDRDFPGHYLRLIQRVRTSVVALIPPMQGIRATLTAAGVSRVVIGGDIFQTVVVRRDPQSVALSSPMNATGLFELDPQAEMTAPFEGLGVDTAWEFRMPRAANLFDYSSIADVLMTIDYTALNSFDYRQQVIQQLDSSISADQPFSLQTQFADQWYDLHNPEQLADQNQMVVRFKTTREDFPPNLDAPKIQQVALYVIRANEATFELPVTLMYDEQSSPNKPGSGRVGGSANTTDGMISTRRGNAGSWAAMARKLVTGEWELALPNTEEVKQRFKQDEITDIVLVITYKADVPAWPK